MTRREMVRVACEVEPGMFRNERSVGVRNISGDREWFFVDTSRVTDASGEGQRVMGELLESDSNRALVRFGGSDGFTTLVVPRASVVSAS